MTNQNIQEPVRQSCLGRVGKTFIISIVVGYLILVAVGMALSMPDIPRKSDALVLLSGGDQTREQEITRLYKKGYAEKVILTRTSGSTRGNHIYTLQDLAKIGVPAEAILFTSGQSDSTYDEARHTVELMDAHNMGAAIVVTDPYHVFRARMIFKGEFRESRKAVWVRGARGHWYNPFTWMLKIQGWEVTVKELGKIGAYLLGFKGG